MEPKIGEANSQIFIFGWRENFLMSISSLISKVALRYGLKQALSGLPHCL
jgi:hypothetical protein